MATLQSTLSKIATFEHQVTGVTVTTDERIVVNFPRWTEDAPVSVAEVMKDGSIKQYPDADWNSWRNAKKNEISASDHFVCVQSVVADGKGNVWVLDPAAPATAAVVPGGPKLVCIDLASDQVRRVIRFDDTVAPNGSYLNDVRFSTDGSHAYITDSGGQGAIVVVDLNSGKARRLLAADPSVQAEKDVIVKVDGTAVRRPDGRGIEFASDGIAISSDGSYLYWKAVTARTLYRIVTSALLDESLSAPALAGKVERVGETVVSDGLWMDADDRLYITAPEANAVMMLDGGRMFTVVKDKQLRWPDTLSAGPDGTLYVTASCIPDMSWYKPNNPAQLAGTSLFRIETNG